MKVLIFGGSGFLGEAVKSLLDKNNIDNYTVSRTNQKSDYNIDISIYKDFEYLPNDYFTIIINCATILPGGNYLDSEYLDQIYKTNILGSQNICKWIDKQNTINKIINCSTLVVVKKPWTANLTEEDVNTYPEGKHVLYCSSKLTQELLFKTFTNDKKITLTQIRFSSLYGENMNINSLICNLIEKVKKREDINITNGNFVSADFLHVEDAAKIILKALQNEINGVLNGASGIETTILDLAKVINKLYNYSVIIHNLEGLNVEEDRCLISVEKLNKYIDCNKFIALEDGIKKMLS